MDDERWPRAALIVTVTALGGVTLQILGAAISALTTTDRDFVGHARLRAFLAAANIGTGILVVLAAVSIVVATELRDDPSSRLAGLRRACSALAIVLVAMSVWAGYEHARGVSATLFASRAATMLGDAAVCALALAAVWLVRYPAREAESI